MKDCFNIPRGRRGFTLVEVIVVLVILAVLAALLIPAMTGWIDKAEDKSVIVEARTALLAAQTIMSETYGGDRNIAELYTTFQEDVRKLAGVEGAAWIISYTDKFQITGFGYRTTDGKTATYENGVWTVS